MLASKSCSLSAASNLKREVKGIESTLMRWLSINHGSLIPSYMSNISSKFKSRPSSSSGSENNWVETPRVKAAEGAKAEAEDTTKVTNEMIAIFIFV